MVSRYEYSGGVWIDLEQPSQDELREVADEFSISERLRAELLSPTPSPLVAGDEHTELLVLHFPTQQSDGPTRIQELDIIVGTHFIVTVRYEIIVPLHHLKKTLEVQYMLGKQEPLTTPTLLEILFAHLYKAMRNHTTHTAENLTRIEQSMFEKHERNIVHLISKSSREFLHLEAAITNQEEPLSRFLRVLTERNFFGPSFAVRAERVLAERAQVARLITTYRAIATELRETNLALLGSHQNDIMKRLTVINSIFLPLGLISWIFAMRMDGMPLIHSPNAFWLVLLLMILVATLLAIFFMKRDWLR